jgi:hypothetical protein
LKLLRRCLRELWTLFVDDGVVAASVVIWITVACLALQRIPVGTWSGPILFAGLAAIVAVSLRSRR